MSKPDVTITLTGKARWVYEHGTWFLMLTDCFLGSVRDADNAWFWRSYLDDVKPCDSLEDGMSKLAASFGLTLDQIEGGPGK